MRVVQRRETGGRTRERRTGKFRVQSAQILIKEDVSVPRKQRRSLIVLLENDPTQEALEEMIRVTPSEIRVAGGAPPEEGRDVLEDEVPLPHLGYIRRRDELVALLAKNLNRLVIEPVELRVLSDFVERGVVGVLLCGVDPENHD